MPTHHRSVVSLYRGLDQADRARFAPALDVYLPASDLMGQVRVPVGRASKIAAAELVIDGAGRDSHGGA